MQKLKCILFGSLIMLARWCFGQDAVNTVDLADSAVYYFQESRKTDTIDLTLFQKGLGFVSQLDLTDSSTLAKMDAIAGLFRQQDAFWNYNALKAEIASNLLRSGDLELAINYCKELVNVYNVDRDPNIRLSAMFALMEIRMPLRKKDIASSFAFYTEQLNVYLPYRDSVALAICYFGLATSYRQQGLIDLSVYYIKKSQSYIDKQKTGSIEPMSGLSAYTNHISVLAQLYVELGDYPQAIKYANEAKYYKLHELNETNVSFLNCNIAFAEMMMNDLDSVYYWLDVSYPMAKDAQDFPSLVRILELKGMYFIQINALDSAEQVLTEAKTVMAEYNVSNFSSAGFHKPNYFLAQIRILQNRYSEAQVLLEQEIPNILSIRAEALKELKLLMEVYLRLGNTQAAEKTFKQYADLDQQVKDEERRNRNISFEVESKIAEAEGTITQLVTEKRIADLTKRYLICVAGLLLIVAAVIFNRFRVTRRQKHVIEKEKKRSDELLLNILPAEVANELKAKGMADAKQFDSVTVMFTDFKGFTKISERLSAAELVAEIDLCFKSFDEIITRHGIEKIKTIGDAYMCAGGLPVMNKTHPRDVVAAALEIQAFMQSHLNQRKLDGKEIFEIRIGIHTGQVVAGIVGVKKFAYDIWGDTVNIASRMESSGEAGKINISGAVYALVKDDFKCTYRGKIEAKNKGEIDMYFVDGY